MPTIYDNIQRRLLDGLREVMASATAADFCVGHFNLRGCDDLTHLVEAAQRIAASALPRARRSSR